MSIILTRIKKKKRIYSKITVAPPLSYFDTFLLLYSPMTAYISGSEILEFSSVINFDIITSGDINFHFHFLP